MNIHLMTFRALAITALVLRHKYWPFPDFLFIASTIPLFLFSSGYFYRPESEKTPLRFLGYKFNRLMVPYYIYNAVYALITYLIFLGTGKVLGHLPTWHNYFIRPFVDGLQYELINPMWFVPFFFVGLFVYLCLSTLIRRFTKDETMHFIVFAAIGIGGYGLRHFVDPGQSLPLHWMFKVLIGVFYFSLGRFFALKLSGLDIYRWRFLFLALVIRATLFFEFKTTLYSYYNAEFTHICSLAFTLIDIYFLLFLAHLILRFSSITRWSCAIGRNSYHVMANHMMVFLLLDWTFAALFQLDTNNHQVLRYVWWVFAIAALVLPVGIGNIARLCRQKINHAVISLFYHPGTELTNHSTEK